MKREFVKPKSLMIDGDEIDAFSSPPESWQQLAGMNKQS
jgi:hypothetical protein